MLKLNTLRYTLKCIPQNQSMWVKWSGVTLCYVFRSMYGLQNLICNWSHWLEIGGYGLLICGHDLLNQGYSLRICEYGL